MTLKQYLVMSVVLMMCVQLERDKIPCVGICWHSQMDVAVLVMDVEFKWGKWSDVLDIPFLWKINLFVNWWRFHKFYFSFYTFYLLSDLTGYWVLAKEHLMVVDLVKDVVSMSLHQVHNNIKTWAHRFVICLRVNSQS